MLHTNINSLKEINNKDWFIDSLSVNFQSNMNRAQQIKP